MRQKEFLDSIDNIAKSIENFESLEQEVLEEGSEMVIITESHDHDNYFRTAVKILRELKALKVENKKRDAGSDSDGYEDVGKDRWRAEGSQCG